MRPRLGRFAAGTVTAAAIAAAARRSRALAPSGAVAATLVGGAVTGGLGWRDGVALVAFFASSTLLGRIPQPAAMEEQRRGDERDAVQVLANGGVPALLALASSLARPAVCDSLRVGLGGAIATAAADTWATEIGSRWGGRPRSIATMRPVERGASGGVTGAGIAASVAGAATIAAVFNAASHEIMPARPMVSLTIGGFSGALADSLLGATLQEVRWCDTCRKETEALVHRCGTPTQHLRGYAWCDNDAVNALATAVGALVATSVASTGR